MFYPIADWQIIADTSLDFYEKKDRKKAFIDNGDIARQGDIVFPDPWTDAH